MGVTEWNINDVTGEQFYMKTFLPHFYPRSHTD